jgi:long-chain acyl-CoA synthetase
VCDPDDSARGVAAGAPLAAIRDLIGGPRVDNLVSRAAGTAPLRCALRAGATAVSYRTLDSLASRCALVLRGLAGRPGTVIAVAAALDPAFAVAYYGVARSGNISAIVNPLLKAEGLAHVLRASEAEVAVLTPGLWEQLRLIPGRLPRLRHVLLTGSAAGPDTAAGSLAGVLADLLRQAGDQAPPVPGTGQEDVACIMFTSGTTGAPKAVPLTHRQILVNAAQTAHAQDVHDDAIMFNYLPTFHTMHLNAAVCAGATQILHTGGDVSESVRAASRHGVTHYYTLPMRLNLLAAHPQLTSLALPSARGLLSGGSALPERTAAVLSAHFGIPVVQGYGLAEASPLTHFNNLTAARPGSCGQPVAGTQCRIVDIVTRQVVSDELGEVQVRGPQVMAGYLDGQSAGALDALGWLSTGDIGRLDSDGHLYLTDRLKDVFKSDNYLVSPTELEGLLGRHPAVADCAVADRPDDIKGAVPCGLVVLRGRADLAEIMRFVNSQVPYYMALQALEPVEAIPRSGNGKIQRRDIRDRLKHASGG